MGWVVGSGDFGFGEDLDGRVMEFFDLDKGSVIEDDNIVVTEQGVDGAPFHLEKRCKQLLWLEDKSYQGEQLGLALLADSGTLVVDRHGSAVEGHPHLDDFIQSCRTRFSNSCSPMSLSWV